MNDRQAMFGLIRDIGERFGKLHGIIHSAGIVRDSLIVNKGIQELADVLAPKVTGLAYLDEATRHLELDFLCCFRPLRAAWGTPVKPIMRQPMPIWMHSLHTAAS